MELLGQSSGDSSVRRKVFALLASYTGPFRLESALICLKSVMSPASATQISNMSSASKRRETPLGGSVIGRPSPYSTARGLIRLSARPKFSFASPGNGSGRARHCAVLRGGKRRIQQEHVWPRQRDRPGFVTVSGDDQRLMRGNRRHQPGKCLLQRLAAGVVREIRLGVEGRPAFQD
jgi:hypothetical protein